MRYIDFKERADLDDVFYIINEKISVFDRQVQMLKDQYDQLEKTGKPFIFF